MTERIYFTQYNSANAAHYVGTVSLKEFIDIVRTGKYGVNGDIKKLRAANGDEKKQSLLKSKLMSFTLSGTFPEPTKGEDGKLISHRTDDEIVSHSGLIQIDIDGKDCPDIDLVKEKKKFYDLPFVICGFVSPRGTGLKLIARIKNNVELHRECFAEIEAYFLEVFNVKIDTTCKNPSRICYVSCDEDIYVNQKATEFPLQKRGKKEPKAKRAVENNSQNSESIESNNENDKWFKLSEEWANKHEVFTVGGKNNNYLYHFACSCNRFGVSETHCKLYIASTYSEYYNNAIDKSIESAYKHHPEEHGKFTNIKRFPKASSPPHTEDDEPGEESFDEDDFNFYNSSNDNYNRPVIFWKAKMSQSTDSEGNKSEYLSGVEIKAKRVLAAIAKLNIRYLKPKNLTPKLVEIVDGFVLREIEVTDVKYLFFNWLRNLDEKILTPYRKGSVTVSREMIDEKMVESDNKYFKLEKLDHLRFDEMPEFNLDTKTSKFVYFKNGYIEITAQGVEFKKYQTLKKFIWEGQILQRNWTEKIEPFNHFANNPEKEKPEKTANKSYFEIFIDKVTSVPNPEFKNEYIPHPERKKDFEILIGYYAHQYTGYKIKCVQITDSYVGKDDEANGRSGKSVFAQAFGHFMSNDPKTENIYKMLDGKSEGFRQNKTDKYQECDETTQMVCINDLYKNFKDTESLFTDITEGIGIKNLYKNIYRRLVKILVLKNKPLEIKGASAKDRFIEFQFSDFFKEGYGLDAHFGHWFYSDWDEKELQRFDHFMVHCVQQFFIHFGKHSKLPNPININLDERKLIELTNKDFKDWFTRLLNKEISNCFPEPTGREGEWYNKKTMHNSFLEQYEDYKTFKNGKPLTENQFFRWITTYLEYSPKYKAYDEEKHYYRKDSTVCLLFEKVEGPAPAPKTIDETPTKLSF